MEALLGRQTGQGAPWDEYATALRQRGYDRPRAGGRDDKAHPPIHPVNHLPKDSVTPDEYKVYELITRHFLACLSRDAVGEEKQVEAEIGQETFSARGVAIKELNFLEVYPYEKWF